MIGSREEVKDKRIVKEREGKDITEGGIGGKERKEGRERGERATGQPN